LGALFIEKGDDKTGDDDGKEVSRRKEDK
jgi:hypothetical protein